MRDKSTRYQPFQCRELGLITASELTGAICHQVESPEPENRECPEGEWYCENSECVVREVTIFCKLFGEVLPKMKCPACQKLLKFHHWLKNEILVPYEGE
jgi:hypothetical protein